MRVVSHPEADQELEAAALWYEDQELHLGGDFMDEYERTLERILVDPERWRKIWGENRKLNFDRIYLCHYLFTAFRKAPFTSKR